MHVALFDARVALFAFGRFRNSANARRKRAKNGVKMVDRFNLPSKDVVEIARQIEI